MLHTLGPHVPVPRPVVGFVRMDQMWNPAELIVGVAADLNAISHALARDGLWVV